MILNHDVLEARVLIIDDNQSNVDLLQATLDAEGYVSLLSITDPREAEGLYMAYRPDLVLLDINMPYLDGFQLMEQFKKIEEDSYLPVIVLTALKDEQTRLRALSHGAQDFLTKPFNRLEILTRINNTLMVRLLHNQVKHPEPGAGEKRCRNVPLSLKIPVMRLSIGLDVLLNTVIRRREIILCG